MEINNFLIEYVRSRKVRNINIRVGRDGVKVTMPWFASKSQAEKFVKKKELWIKRKLREFSKFKEIRSNQSSILFLGKEYEPVINTAKRASVKLDSDKIHISLQKGTQKELEQVLEKWYKRRAKSFLTNMVKEKNQKHGHKINQVSVRGQRTLWGSCSSRGNLNFNFKLMLAPPDIVEYIVIHELAHLYEQNHSKRFWAKVQEECPDFRKHEKWLKTYGSSLEILPR